MQDDAAPRTDRQEVGFSRRRTRLPNGVMASFPMLSHPGAAAVVPFISDSTIILIRQYRPSIGQFIWEVPAGKLQPGESPVECAGRELREEAGRAAGRLEHLASLWMEPGFTDEVMHIYQARELRTVDCQREDDELIEQFEMDLDAAVGMVRGERTWDAKTVIALQLASSHRRLEASRREQGP